jgi:non-specific serine/threonine protein kinase
MIDDFANGVWFVELAAVSDPEFLTAAIINAIGIKEEPKKTPEESLVDYLKDKEILIILDNCEHLINACADLTERLLSSCPKLKILATSREALNCSGEQIFRIPALTHPEPNSKDTPEQLTQYESVRLFIERALPVNPKFRVNNENSAALAEVCSRLDGIPLAIELAAARIKVLSIEKIYERLDDRFNLLTGGKRTALPRQQTLRALIDWSYDLLTENEKILWSRLSVFSGGWTLEAAEEICSDESINKYGIIDHLSELAEKSIIIFNESKERYNILETIKQYGREKLENENQIFLKHLDYFLDLAKKAEPELSRSDAKLWLDKLEADHSNFLSAIEWSVENGETEKGAGAAYALAQFWTIRGYHSTGKELLDIIMKKKFELSKSAEAKLLILAGGFFRQRGDYSQAKKSLEESLDINIELSNKHGIADSFSILGCVAINQGDYEEAKRFFEETLRIKRGFGDKRGIALSLNNLGSVAIHQGDFEQAKEFYKGSLDIKKEIGDKQGIAISLNNLGIVAAYQGNFEQTKKYYEESLDIFKEIGDKWGISHSLISLGDVARKLGDFEDAEKFFVEGCESFKDIGDKRGVATSLNNLGIITCHLGNYEQARKYLEESLDIRKEIGDKWGISHSLDDLGNVAFNLGDFEQAKNYYFESLAIKKDIGNKSGIADSMSYLGITAIYQENYETAVKLLSASEKIQESIGSVIETNYQKLENETKAKLREQLSEEEFNKYWEEGQKLTLEEAVELAFKKDDNA